MKLSKNTLRIGIIFGTLLMSMNAYAGPTSTPTVKVAETKAVYMPKITQPPKIDTLTFNKEMNIMGEAKKGTTIKIEVYFGEKESKSVQVPSKVYEELQVGATQTFNQLIGLAIGKNTVVANYVYKDESGSTEFTVVRKSSEEIKEEIKTFNPAQSFTTDVTR